MTGRFVVWGDNTLARRLAGELTDTYGGEVTVVVGSDETDPMPSDVRQLVAARLTPEVLVEAGVAEAGAIALVHRDDVANVDAALMAREVSPTVRIVVRVFSPVLAEAVTTMLGDCGVLSGSEIAAPAFVAAALGDDAPTYVRLPKELLVAMPRAATTGEDVVCGLAVTGGLGLTGGLTEPERLPADQSAADVVLVRRYGAPPDPPPRPRRQPLHLTRLIFGRRLRIALLATAGLLALATVVFALLRDLDPWSAIYLALVTALGGPGGGVDGSAVEQIVDVLLVLAGVALVPVVTVLVVESVVSAKLALAAGGLTRPISGHVIVVGLGNVGTRVLRELREFGVEVVGVDRAADARGVQVARELGVPVVIANGNSAETLRAASIATCRALLVLSTDDVTNLETALLGRALHPTRLRVVLRLFDEDFARRVKRAFDITLSRSVSYLAAPAFAAAMLGREVVGTIPVGRRVLLVAELPVGAGSELEGELCPEVSRPNEVRLIAVRTGRGRQTLWSLPERRRLVRTDRILVVATRAGLGSLLARTAPVADPPPLVEPEPLRLLNIYTWRPPS